MTTARIVHVIRHRPDLMPAASPVSASVAGAADLGASPIPASADASALPPFPADGPLIWQGIHQTALAFDLNKSKAARARLRVQLPGWFAEHIAGMLPCGHCRTDWARMLRDTPPDFKALFSWTVARHNEVNRKLGKPEIGEESARALWDRSFLGFKYTRKPAKAAKSPRGAGKDTPRKRRAPQKA